MKGAALVLLFALAGCGDPAPPTVPGNAAPSTSPDADAATVAVLAALDEADPAQAAIARWHRALVDGDFEAFHDAGMRSTTETPDVDKRMNRLMFDAIRPGVPSVVLAAEDPGELIDLLPPEDRALLAGLRTFMLVGCLTAPGDTQPTRRIAAISVREIDGQWKVIGGSFGDANEWFRGDCPLDDDLPKAR